MTFLVVVTALILSAGAKGTSPSIPTVQVGSKSFTEGFILEEVLAQSIESAGEVSVKRNPGLGGTGIVFTALEENEIQLYAEYTGTLTQAILKENTQDFKRIQELLTQRGLVLGKPFGFNNTYAFGVRRKVAEKLGLKTIGDLRRHPEIKAAISYEFMKRPDGLEGALKHYGVKLNQISPMEHALAYQAIMDGKADLVDVYSTDAKIEKLDLVVLEDDLKFFPIYLGVPVARQDFIEKSPKSWAKVTALGGTLNERRMRELNALVELQGLTPAQAAQKFLGQTKGSDEVSSSQAFRELMNRTREHLFLVLISLMGSCLAGIPLGILASRVRSLRQAVLMVSGLLQTIPSLALLCFLIPLFGIGTTPSIVALFLYGLLPIVRNTFTGIESLDHRLREVQGVMGLSTWKNLLKIEIPLASVHILSGIKTSAVMSVGTATLAALIGAGGYGVLIVQGLSLNSIPLILTGAIPSAALALLLHLVFEALDFVLVPKGLRLAKANR